MIQAMIAAAHADGTLDTAEEEMIIRRLDMAGLEEEEKEFLRSELHRPRSIEELTKDINNPATARTMFMLAKSAIDVDTQAEQLWLDQLAAALPLDSQ
jgi:uncharacterized membrane protein YebE (DUF533 family)